MPWIEPGALWLLTGGAVGGLEPLTAAGAVPSALRSVGSASGDSASCFWMNAGSASGTSAGRTDCVLGQRSHVGSPTAQSTRANLPPAAITRLPPTPVPTVAVDDSTRASGMSAE